MRRPVSFVRLVLSGLLVYFVWKETGPATTIFAGLVLLAIELQSRTFEVILSILKKQGGK